LMEAGDFFEKLRRINTADGPRFRKDNSDVTSFPASLDITVMIHAIRCDGDIHNPVTSALDPALVGTFQLKAEWKKPDGALRKGHAEFSEPSVTKVTQSQLELRFKGKVDSDKVNIGDRLVLSLLTDKGDRIARVSGGASGQ